MFISTGFLVTNYGVDEKIAKFFVDRDPPKDNLYWHEKLLYLRPAPGYLFIPLIVDLLYKTGIDRDELLSEEFVHTMEQTGHFSALEESGQITMQEAIEKCDHLVKPDCKDEEWYSNLTDFLMNKKENFFSRLSTPYKALHRGDVFLYSVCILSLPKDFYTKIAEIWFALIAVILLLDDAKDIKEDMETGDENAFVESGLTKESLEKILELAKNSLEKVAIVNPVMAQQLQKTLTETLQLPEVAELLPEFNLLWL